MFQANGAFSDDINHDFVQLWVAPGDAFSMQWTGLRVEHPWWIASLRRGEDEGTACWVLAWPDLGLSDFVMKIYPRDTILPEEEDGVARRTADAVRLQELPDGTLAQAFAEGGGSAPARAACEGVDDRSADAASVGSKLRIIERGFLL